MNTVLVDEQAKQQQQSSNDIQHTQGIVTHWTIMIQWNLSNSIVFDSKIISYRLLQIERFHCMTMIAYW